MFSDKLYKKTITCPICKQKTQVNMYKKGTFKIKDQDFDMHVSYEGLNPLLYEIFLCNHCGYANTSKYFDTIRNEDKLNIQKNISTKWHSIELPDDNSVEFAIYLYKLTLANRNFYRKTYYGELGVINLRLSWLYNELNDSEQVERFRKFALDCLLQAYLTEDMPIGGLFNESISCYILGALYYYLKDRENSLQWLNKVITDRTAQEKLKNKARDLKELLKQK